MFMEERLFHLTTPDLSEMFTEHFGQIDKYSALGAINIPPLRGPRVRSTAFRRRFPPKGGTPNLLVHQIQHRDQDGRARRSAHPDYRRLWRCLIQS